MVPSHEPLDRGSRVHRVNRHCRLVSVSPPGRLSGVQDEGPAPYLGRRAQAAASGAPSKATLPRSWEASGWAEAKGAGNQEHASTRTPCRPPARGIAPGAATVPSRYGSSFWCPKALHAGRLGAAVQGPTAQGRSPGCRLILALAQGPRARQAGRPSAGSPKPASEAATCQASREGPSWARTAPRISFPMVSRPPPVARAE